MQANMPQIRKDQAFSLIIALVLLLILPVRPGHVLEELSENLLTTYQIESSSVPVLKSESQLGGLLFQAQAQGSNNWSPDNLTASAAAVIDLDSKSVLFEKSASGKYLPASTTKLMTAIVARQEYQLGDEVQINEVPKIVGASIGFINGEKITVRDLLKASLIQSGNESAILLAEHHPGGADEFIRLMNQKAQELHLDQTHFANVTGLDHPDHYSSAKDLALLSRKFMSDSVLREIVATKTTTIGDVRGWYRHQIWNTHRLLNPDEGFVGVKTGTTDGAGEVLITQVERNDRKLLFVLLGSLDRYEETLSLLEWVESNYTWVENNAYLE